MPHLLVRDGGGGEDRGEIKERKELAIVEEERVGERGRKYENRSEERGASGAEHYLD